MDRRNPVRAALTDLAMAALKNREMEMAEQIAAVLDRYEAVRPADKPRQPRRRNVSIKSINPEGGDRHAPVTANGPDVATVGGEVSSPTEEQPPAVLQALYMDSKGDMHAIVDPDLAIPPDLDRRGKK